jgi:hypothetical protein
VEVENGGKKKEKKRQKTRQMEVRKNRSIMGQCLVKGLLTFSTLWRKEEVLSSHASSSWCQKAFYYFDAASRPYMESAKYVPSLCMPNYSLMA